jgi:hypothetical protein
MKARALVAIGELAFLATLIGGAVILRSIG